MKCLIFTDSKLTTFLRQVKEITMRVLQQLNTADIWEYQQGHQRETKLQTTKNQ